MLPEVILGLASGAFSLTVAQSKLFAPLREWVKARWRWGGELIGCPFCLGHWSAALLTVLWWPLLAVAPPRATMIGITLVTKWLTIVAISSFTSGGIGRLYGGED